MHYFDMLCLFTSSLLKTALPLRIAGIRNPHGLSSQCGHRLSVSPVEVSPHKASQKPYSFGKPLQTRNCMKLWHSGLPPSFFLAGDLRPGTPCKRVCDSFCAEPVEPVLLLLCPEQYAVWPCPKLSPGWLPAISGDTGLGHIVQNEIRM